MIPAAVRSKGFSAGFFFAVTIVFVLQVGALFWFGRSSAAGKPIPGNSGPIFKLSDSYSRDIAALEDPTLFVLPNARSFPEESWMKINGQSYEAKAWDEPLRWLKLSPEILGVSFVRFVQSLPAFPAENISISEPTLTYPNILPASIVEQLSRFHIEGELAGRRILNRPALSAQANAGSAPLGNSIVQVLVDPQGNVISALLLESGSGSADADEDAMSVAKSLRFESIEPQGPDRMVASKSRVTLGTVIFDWQTLPPTNAPVALP